MPIPTPKSGETQSDFVSRCISEIYDEYGQEQGSAICYSTYRENRMSKLSTIERAMAKISEIRKHEGINLYPSGEVNMKLPCWEGYEQYGTKIVDGREVPNCIPQE